MVTVHPQMQLWYGQFTRPISPTQWRHKEKEEARYWSGYTKLAYHSYWLVKYVGWWWYKQCKYVQYMPQKIDCRINRKRHNNIAVVVIWSIYWLQYEVCNHSQCCQVCRRYYKYIETSLYKIYVCVELYNTVHMRRNIEMIYACERVYI